MPNPKRNYVAYLPSATVQPTPRIGHLDLDNQTIHPLSYASGTPLTTLYEVIETTSSNITESDADPIPLSTIQLLPPVSGRDILAVGKNYLDHANEFHSSGYDSSDKVALPSHPVIFTKRATSLIASGAEIHPHPTYEETLDYEGEIGVILAKPGYRIGRKEAWGYVWGFTLINDVTSRNEQRDHKQFFLGKSGDSYCPMGPVAVPKEHFVDPGTGEFTKVLFETKVNGEVRQKGNFKDLIFDVPALVETVSAAQTVRRGDVIATGTPMGVGFGFSPPKWLRPGDEVAIEAEGLGTLRNKVADGKSVNATMQKVLEESDVPYNNLEKTMGGKGLTLFPGRKMLYYKKSGKEGGKPLVCVHGLGATSGYYEPLEHLLTAEYECHTFDLEGHGLSPTRADSELSIASFAQDLDAVVQHASIQGGITLVGHSLGCLIALKWASENAEKIEKLILMGPPPSPFPEMGAKNNYARARTVREKGMCGVVDGILANGTSPRTQKERPWSAAAVRASLMGQDAEGYAKACMALAGSSKDTIQVDGLKGKKILLLTGSDDKVTPEAASKAWAEKLGDAAEVRVVEGVGHMHLFEDTEGVRKEVGDFLGLG